MEGAQVKRNPGRTALRALATGFGTGFFPAAPGTAGSLLALPLWYLFGGWGIGHFAALGAILAASVPAVRAEMEATGRKDPPTAVIDEVAGMLLAATGVSWGWRSVPVLFLLFRFFDIFKAGPAAWSDRKTGAVFVVADDLFAGLYANAAWRVLAWLTG